MGASDRWDGQSRLALQRAAEPPEGAPVQGAGHRRLGSRKNLHYQALRAPDLLHQLPGHHRSGLRPEGVELGLGDRPASTLGHSRWVRATKTQSQSSATLMRV